MASRKKFCSSESVKLMVFAAIVVGILLASIAYISDAVFTFVAQDPLSKNSSNSTSEPLSHISAPLSHISAPQLQTAAESPTQPQTLTVTQAHVVSSDLLENPLGTKFRSKRLQKLLDYLHARPGVSWKSKDSYFPGRKSPDSTPTEYHLRPRNRVSQERKNTKVEPHHNSNSTAQNRMQKPQETTRKHWEVLLKSVQHKRNLKLAHDIRKSDDGSIAQFTSDYDLKELIFKAIQYVLYLITIAVASVIDKSENGVLTVENQPSEGYSIGEVFPNVRLSYAVHSERSLKDPASVTNVFKPSSAKNAKPENSGGLRMAVAKFPRMEVLPNENSKPTGLRRHKRAIRTTLQVLKQFLEPFARVNYNKLLRKWFVYNLFGNVGTAVYASMKDGSDRLHKDVLKMFFGDFLGFPSDNDTETGTETTKGFNDTFSPINNTQNHSTTQSERAFRYSVQQRSQSQVGDEVYGFLEYDLKPPPQFPRPQPNNAMNFPQLPNQSPSYGTNFYEYSQLRPPPPPQYAQNQIPEVMLPPSTYSYSSVHPARRTNPHYDYRNTPKNSDTFRPRTFSHR